MANFHTNLLAIAANEENMCKVLIRMAMNLAANKEATDFDMQDIAGLETAKEIYCKVGPAVDAYYIFAFAGAPIPEEAAVNSMPGWTSSTSSESDLIMQLQALTDAIAQFNGDMSDEASMGLITTAPTGRGLSETASVGFTRYGENWLLTVYYDTAWAPNSADLDVFFRGLPQGDYGVAFFDADEYDEYESISMFSGLHHGRANLHDVDESENWNEIENSDLKALQRECSSISKAGIGDIAELAKLGATCCWSTWGWDDDDDDDDYCETASWNQLEVNWENPKEEDLRVIDNLIIEAVSSFPWVSTIEWGFSPQGNDAAESLFPGDAVTVVSDWVMAERPSDVFFRVYDAAGSAIGNLGHRGELREGWTIHQSFSAVLACLLPHITTTVWKLEPVSLRHKEAEGPHLVVRFDLEPVSAEDLHAETHALLEKERKDRSLSSKGEE